MLVYANHLTMQGSAAPSAALRSVGVWLKEQLGFGLHPEQLVRDGEFPGRRGDTRSWLRIRVTREETPELYSWVLKNADDRVKGRQWITELGMKISEGILELSCVVRTDELSALVAEPVSASRPRLVPYLIREIQTTPGCEFSPTVPGLSLKIVGQDTDSYRGLVADIEYSERDYPIVLVSPDAEGNFLVNPHHLQESLSGLAQVVRVSVDFNSYDMEEVLGRAWSAWNGAVNVLQMPTLTGSVRGRPFLSDAIETWGASQHERVSEVLKWVTNYTNVPRLRRRIRSEGVVQLSMRRRLQAMFTTAAEMDAEQLRQQLDSANRLVQDQEELLELLSSDNSRLEAEFAESAAALEETHSNLQKKEYAVQALKDQLDRAGAGRSSELDVETLLSLVCRNDQPTPTECLEVLQSVHGDKCVLLDSAWKSARQLNRFVYGRRLLDMLLRLVTVYRTDLVRSGAGDNVARKHFGKSGFAATESDSVAKNRETRRARTFEYQGQPILMLRHLKIGVDDDESRTIRVHFHWDAGKERIVIGHCGLHLPLA